MAAAVTGPFKFVVHQDGKIKRGDVANLEPVPPGVDRGTHSTSADVLFDPGLFINHYPQAGEHAH